MTTQIIKPNSFTTCKNSLSVYKITLINVESVHIQAECILFISIIINHTFSPNVLQYLNIVTLQWLQQRYAMF